MVRKQPAPSSQKPEVLLPDKSKESVKPAATVVSPSIASNDDELDVTKDNLRMFVERWREHPESPYIIESPPKGADGNLPPESESLKGHSPSPRDSLRSSPSESSTPRRGSSQQFFLTVPGIERRSSESVATEKPIRDPASQIVLAEEIIKLSEHLRSLANSPDVPESDEKQSGSDRKRETRKAERSETNEITEKLCSIVSQRKLNGTKFNNTRSFQRTVESGANSGLYNFKKYDKKSKSSRARATTVNVDNQEFEREMDLIPPWRKPRIKKRFCATSRDVPRISRLKDVHKSLNLDEPSSTKDLLLHLLNEWDDVASRSSPGIGRKSISVDWCNEDIARRSLNSLAEYFQSEQQKSNNPTSPPSSIHR